MHADLLGHLHHRGEDAAGALAEGAEKTHVQLEFVEAVVLEHVQGGIAAAEVVHPDLIAGLPEAFHHVAHLSLLFGKDAFGDLYIEKIVGDMAGTGVFIHGKNIALCKVHARQVDGNGNRGLVVFNRLTNAAADRLDHKAVKPVDALCLLEYRDKGIGRQHAALRVDPAGESFKAAKQPGDRADHRLVIDLYMTSGKGGIKAFQYKSLQAFFHGDSFQKRGY